MTNETVWSSRDDDELWASDYCADCGRNSLSCECFEAKLAKLAWTFRNRELDR